MNYYFPPNYSNENFFEKLNMSYCKYTNAFNSYVLLRGNTKYSLCFVFLACLCNYNLNTQIK